MPAGFFVDVSVGAQHACAVETSGGVECWGDDFYGQSNAPVSVFTQATAGGLHSCGIDLLGNVVCWGDNT